MNNTFIPFSYLQGIKVIIDFVPNHTGRMHPWFDRDTNANTNNYYYIWDCEVNNDPPNNWVSRLRVDILLRSSEIVTDTN